MSLNKDEKRKYSIEPYDPDWVERFRVIKQFVRSVFGDKALQVEHVGSTSVPDMKAKPVIDVLVVVKKMAAFTEEKERMVEAGYQWGENYIAPNTMILFKTAVDGRKTENIHVCEQGAPKVKQFLVIRDFLRAFPDKAREYAALKEKNYALYPRDYPAYREAKAPFLASIEQEAYRWNDQKSSN